MTDLAKLATDILNGDTLPFGSYGVYDSADWIDAAQQAFDPIEQDFAALRAMVAKEGAWERFSTVYRGDLEFGMYCERIVA